VSFGCVGGGEGEEEGREGGGGVFDESECGRGVDRGQVVSEEGRREEGKKRTGGRCAFACAKFRGFRGYV